MQAILAHLLQYATLQPPQRENDHDLQKRRNGTPEASRTEAEAQADQVTELPAYLAGLVAMCLVALGTGWRHREYRNQLWRVAGVIALNWCAGVLYVSNTGNYTPWEFSIFIDSAAAFAIMYHPAGRIQGYIGLLYLLQIAAHIAYGARIVFGYLVDDVLYYDTLTWIAWAQLLAVGGWSAWIWRALSRPRRATASRRASFRSDGAK